jgi:DNA-binding transcriptional MerR regulator
MPKCLRTIDIAKALGIHVNTVRKYEQEGLLPPIPRGTNGYRCYSELHLEQARLVLLVTNWPYVGERSVRLGIVQNVLAGDYGKAMELAYQYLAAVRVERTYAEAALEFLERWAKQPARDAPRQVMPIGQAAKYLGVSLDMLRNWERNGLVAIPRDPLTGYRLYGANELARLRVIRMLLRSGYSLLAIRRMFSHFDAGQTEGLADLLEFVPDDEKWQVPADRWLASLQEVEERAQAIIHQVGLLSDLAWAD